MVVYRKNTCVYLVTCAHELLGDARHSHPLDQVVSLHVSPSPSVFTQPYHHSSFLLLWMSKLNIYTIPRGSLGGSSWLVPLEKFLEPESLILFSFSFKAPVQHKQLKCNLKITGKGIRCGLESLTAESWMPALVTEAITRSRFLVKILIAHNIPRSSFLHAVIWI